MERNIEYELETRLAKGSIGIVTDVMALGFLHNHGIGYLKNTSTRYW